MSSYKFHYSDIYRDSNYEYRNVVAPAAFVRLLPKRLLTEREWTFLGIRQEPEWEHYMIFEREPHILLFRRPIQSVSRF